MAIRDSQLTRIALDLWADLERRTELPVRGISMWPVLRSGERIVVRHGGAPPRIGQVIVLLHGEKVLAHRVIRFREEDRRFVLRTKGDTCLVPEPGWFDSSHVVGVVEGVMKGARLTRRRGLDGALGRALARLSRAVSALFSPLYALWVRCRRRTTRPGKDE